MSHAVDHRSQNGDPGIVQLTPSSLHLRESADVIPRSNHGAVGPAAQDQRVGNRKDRRRVDDDQVVQVCGAGPSVDQISAPGAVGSCPESACRLAAGKKSPPEREWSRRRRSLRP